MWNWLKLDGTMSPQEAFVFTTMCEYGRRLVLIGCAVLAVLAIRGIFFTT